MYAFLRWVLKILWLNICPFLSVKNMVVVLCLGGSLKKKIWTDFWKKFIVSFRKTFEFSVNSNIKLLSKLQKKMFQKMSCIRTKRILERCPILRNFDKFKKVQKKVFNICLTLDFFAIFQSTIKSRICWL